MKSKAIKKLQIKAIIYDCVGPLLIKNQKITLDPIVVEINNKCGNAINEKKFWSEIQKSYNLKTNELKSIKEEIINYYILNKDMHKFNRNIIGKYKTGIINNGASSTFRKWIKKFNFKKDYDVLLNSTELGIKKPDAEIYKLVAKKLNVLPKECVFIDDNELNTIGSEKVGMIGVVYKPGHHQEFIERMHEILD